MFSAYTNTSRKKQVIQPSATAADATVTTGIEWMIWKNVFPTNSSIFLFAVAMTNVWAGSVSSEKSDSDLYLPATVTAVPSSVEHEQSHERQSGAGLTSSSHEGNIHWSNFLQYPVLEVVQR